MNFADAVEDLVERSRLGEQNASSQIDVLGEQYRRGRGFVESQGGDWRQIQRSYQAIEAYVASHPYVVTVEATPCEPCSPPATSAPTSVNLGSPRERHRERRTREDLALLPPEVIAILRGSPPRLPPGQSMVTNSSAPPAAIPLPGSSPAGAILSKTASFGQDASPAAPGSVCALLCALPLASLGANADPDQAADDRYLACAVVLLAFGPMLTSRRVSDAASALGTREAWESFLRGVNLVGPPGAVSLDVYHFAGRAHGRASRIQRVRRGESPSILDPAMAWELGE